MCIAYSCMNTIYYARMSKEEGNARVAYARKHLELCIKLYRIQLDAGRYFLHEHPATATSWQEGVVKKLMTEEAVERVMGDQCRYGLSTKDGSVIGPAKKPTGFMTNSVCIARRLMKKCPNTTRRQVHQHIRLENGRAQAAQIYLDELCKEMCEGLIEQIEVDRKGQFLIADYDADKTKTSRDLLNLSKQLKWQYKTVEGDHEEGLETAWGDVSGAELKPELVKRARQEEIQYVRKMNRYDKVLVEECYKNTGRAPISVRWIDINKGDAEHPQLSIKICGSRKQIPINGRTYSQPHPRWKHSK